MDGRSQQKLMIHTYFRRVKSVALLRRGRVPWKRTHICPSWGFGTRWMKNRKKGRTEVFLRTVEGNIYCRQKREYNQRQRYLGESRVNMTLSWARWGQGGGESSHLSRQVCMGKETGIAKIAKYRGQRSCGEESPTPELEKLRVCGWVCQLFPITDRCC